MPMGLERNRQWGRGVCEVGRVLRVDMRILGCFWGWVGEFISCGADWSWADADRLRRRPTHDDGTVMNGAPAIVLVHAD
jgi:hypothetical protein